MKKLTIVITVLFLTALVISGIAGWFYWFQWRPSEIRKVCSSELQKWKSGGEKEAASWFKDLVVFEEKRTGNKYLIALGDERSVTDLTPKETDQTYRNCIRYKGLE